MIRTIETEYVYSEHDGGWYAEQARPDHATHGMRYEFRTSSQIYPTREACERAVCDGRCEFSHWC